MPDDEFAHLERFPDRVLAEYFNVPVEQVGEKRADLYAQRWLKATGEEPPRVVDTVTFVVCGSAGLDGGGESIPYVAGWKEDGALEAVAVFATLIDSLARRSRTP